MTIYNPKIHHRRSIRLKGYDYTRPGAYFVTLATWQRECLFGEVVNGMVRLSLLGEIVRQEWQRSAQIRGEIELFDDQFVIMPNHIHGIVWLVDVGADGIRQTNDIHPTCSIHPTNIVDLNGAGVDGINPASGVHPINIVHMDRVGVDGVHPSHPGIPIATGCDDQDAYRDWEGADHYQEGARRAPLRRDGRSLGSFVAGFKASVTSRARHELEIWNIWQRNYYEHIIRDQAELARICEYIQTNPNRWEDDQLHPAAASNRFNQE